MKLNCARPVSSASRGDMEVNHALRLKVEFQMHTVISNENGKFCTTMIYPCFTRSVCFFRWDRLLDEGMAFVQAGVPLCLDDVTFHSCAHFKCDVTDVNKEILTDFRASNAYLVNVTNHIVKIVHDI